MIAAVVRSRVRMARRDMMTAPAGQRWSRHPAVAIVLSLALAWLVFSGLAHVFATLDAAGAGAIGRTGMLALALSGALVALLAFDVDDVVRTMLLDPDLELLRRAPRSPLALLAIKAFDAAPRTLLPLVVMAAPAVAAYVATCASPFAAAAVSAVVLLVLWAMALAAGVALSLALLRFAPASRAREALGLVSTLVLTLLWIAGALLLPRSLQLDPQAAGALTATLETAARAAGPSAAAARAIAAAGAGDLGPAGFELAALAGMAVATAAFVALVCRFALADVVERIASAASSSATRPAARGARTTRWRAEGAILAIVRRDGRMLRRSWTLLGDLLVASALWALLPLAGLAEGSMEWAGLVRLVLLTIAVGLGYEVAARSIPFERRAPFWASVAPIPPERFALAKLLGATVVSAPIVLLVGGVLLAVRPPTAEGLVELACLLPGALLLSQATGLWAGATFGDPEWVNPRAMLRFTGRLITSLLVLVQLGFWLGAIYWLEIAQPPSFLGARLGILVLASVLAVLPAWAAARRLARLDSRH